MAKAACIAVVLAAFAASISHAQEALRPHQVVRDSIPASLTGAKGDAGRGRAIVANRQVGLCLLCHTGPFPEERFQGSLAPDLNGTGARFTEGQLRLRVVDASRANALGWLLMLCRSRALDRLRKAAVGTENTMPPLLDAVRAYATIGEMCDALRDVWGEYQEQAII